MIKAKLILVLFAISGSFSVTYGDVRMGDLVLKDKHVSANDGQALVIGDMVKLRVFPYIADFFDTKVIDATATVENTTVKTMFGQFSVAFFDKENHLLGCASQSLGVNGLKAGDHVQLGSCMVHLPPAELPRVARYQLTLYVSEVEF